MDRLSYAQFSGIVDSEGSLRNLFDFGTGVLLTLLTMGGVGIFLLYSLFAASVEAADVSVVVTVSGDALMASDIDASDTVLVLLPELLPRL